MLDLVAGRQLERFGPYVCDRPFEAAAGLAADTVPPAPEWATADLRFERWHGHGRWRVADDEALPEAWTMRHEGLVFELRPTDTGQVGFFGDQVANWRWLRERITAPPRRGAAAPAPGPVRVLNLFAYTGGSTLFAAKAGAEVTHVDASRPSVAWARRNAELSGLTGAPIRWIVDDAVAFVERETRRGRRYDGVILDPPSYGHGRGGRRWQLAEQLPELLRVCAGVLSETPSFVLLTAHTTGLAADAVGDALKEALGTVMATASAERVLAEPVLLQALTGRAATAGSMARWPR
ncbi:MAG: SAM-dependent methyltransferase [Chloroflexi bacterium]|nr:SAM-dependent methyltransferase [Chloroflexota bacterium]